MIGLLPIATIAFGLTVAILHLLLVRGWARKLAIDNPNQRSLHVTPIPRVGGVVMIPMALLSSMAYSESSAILSLIAAGLCAISFIDDRWGLPVGLRLVSHVAAAIIACQSLAFPFSPWEFGLAVILLVWVCNLFNFMDGTDGLAGGMALFGFVILGWTILDGPSGMAQLSFSLAAAAAGFLLFNFSPARVFMGDAGSVPLGFLVGGVGCYGWTQESWPLWFPLLVFSPFVVDASVTLMKRLLRRERFWLAHRDHYYQRLVRMGWPHRRVALAEYALMGACGGSALALLHARAELQVAGLSAWLAVYAALMLAIDGRWATQVTRSGDRG